jgi:AcrR family transcriptional regulator
MVIASSGPAVQARKTRKELLSEWRHQEVLEAARHIFAKLGYAAANMEEIAKQAGMAKGTVYLYFKSKEEVFADVLASDLESLTNRTIEGMSAVATFQDRITVFLNLRLAYVKNNADFLNIYLAEFGSRGSRSPLIAQVIEKEFRRGLEFLRRCLNEAIAKGELRPMHVEHAAFAIFDLARGFAERHLRGWSKLSLEEDFECTRALIVKGFAK